MFEKKKSLISKLPNALIHIPNRSKITIPRHLSRIFQSTKTSTSQIGKILDSSYFLYVARIKLPKLKEAITDNLQRFMGKGKDK